MHWGFANFNIGYMMMLNIILNDISCWSKFTIVMKENCKVILQCFHWSCHLEPWTCNKAFSNAPWKLCCCSYGTSISCELFYSIMVNFIHFVNIKELFSRNFQVGGNWCNSSIWECWRWTHIVNPFIYEIKVTKKIVWTSPNYCGHVFPTFFTLEIFPHDATFKEWMKTKVLQLEA